MKPIDFDADTLKITTEPTGYMRSSRWSYVECLPRTRPVYLNHLSMTILLLAHLHVQKNDSLGRKHVNSAPLLR